MKPDYTPGLIKFFAVVTAAPRWVVALMAAEGLALPDDWLIWWIAASAIMAASMAVVEGVAFSYVFSAWRVAKGRASNILGGLAFASAAVFVGVIAPYIAASVRGVALSAILSADWALYVWAACVAASTIMIVASVGYAQKTQAPQGTTQTTQHKTQAQISTKIERKTPENKAEVSGKKWKDVDPEDYPLIAQMSTLEIMTAYGLIGQNGERNARNWRKHAKERSNGKAKVSA